MRESVSAVFISTQAQTCFSMKRQDYLSVFPGYTSFPGGKVDKLDISEPLTVPGAFSQGITPVHWTALDREMKEELGFSLRENLNLIEEVYLLGTAITPEFNPYRFKSYFYIISLKEEVEFQVDPGETYSSEWIDPKKLLDRYNEGSILAVPPTVQMIQTLAHDLYSRGPLDFKLETIEEFEVPMIESVKGVKQFMPLSHTFPPANRTNCFLVGDKPHRYIIDPSPRDQNEFEKLCRSLDHYGFDHIFISHHHPDHHEHLDWMVEKYGCDVYMGQTTKEFIDLKHGKDYLKKMNIKYLKEGDIIGEALGSPLRVYEVPGHDEGQLGLAPDSLNWFFVGDLIQTIGTVVIGGDEGDMAKYFSSLERIISLAPKVCFPSHGIALGGVQKLIKTLKHRRMREKKIVELLSQGKTQEDILNIIYEGLEVKLLPYARKTIACHIKKIIEESLI
jgi:endoribonuclease LACTB2